MDRIHRASARAGDAKALLNRAGLRATSGRMSVLGVLRMQVSPVSPGRICSLLAGGGVDRATVYRTIDALRHSGIIHRAYSEGRTSFYELSDHCAEDACHPHFHCRACGDITCFYEVPVAPPPAVPEGFVLERRKMTLSGLCPNCSSAQPPAG